MKTQKLENLCFKCHAGIIQRVYKEKGDERQLEIKKCSNKDCRYQYGIKEFSKDYAVKPNISDGVEPILEEKSTTKKLFLSRPTIDAIEKDMDCSPIPVEGEGRTQERMDSMQKVSQMAWNHSIKHYCVKDMKCTKQCNVCKLAEQCNPTPPSANDGREGREPNRRKIESFIEQKGGLFIHDKKLCVPVENAVDGIVEMIENDANSSLPTARSKAEQQLDTKRDAIYVLNKLFEQYLPTGRAHYDAETIDQLHIALNRDIMNLPINNDKTI